MMDSLKVLHMSTRKYALEGDPIENGDTPNCDVRSLQCCKTVVRLQSSIKTTPKLIYHHFYVRDNSNSYFLAKILDSIVDHKGNCLFSIDWHPLNASIKFDFMSATMIHVKTKQSIGLVVVVA